jgi:hypothetical protein
MRIVYISKSKVVPRSLLHALYSELIQPQGWQQSLIILIPYSVIFLYPDLYPILLPDRHKHNT